MWIAFLTFEGRNPKLLPAPGKLLLPLGEEYTWDEGFLIIWESYWVFLSLSYVHVLLNFYLLFSC